VETATPGALLMLAALLGAYLLFLYADYIIVVGNLALLRAVVRSWQTVRVNLWISFAVVLGMLVALNLVAALTSFDLDGSALDVLPALVIRTLLMGSVGFLADVVLLVVYIESVESGRLPDGRG
jgi:hypothetical protein